MRDGLQCLLVAQRIDKKLALDAEQPGLVNQRSGFDIAQRCRCVPGNEMIMRTR